MRYRRLGSSDLELSEISLGSWLTYGGGVGREQAEACVAKAFEVGINFIDTANVYSRGAAESLLGEILVGRPRDSYVLGTKLYFPMNGDRGLSREQVLKQLDLSLMRLRTDHVDLYQYHTPDHGTPFEETFGALDELVREGKVRYVGHSNLEAAQVEEIDALAREHGWARPVSAQNQYSLLRREAEEELLPVCEGLGLGVLPFFPLASGLLTGKYRRGQPPPEGTRLAGRNDVFTEEKFDRIEALEELARERGLSLLQVAISGLAAQPAVASVIAGATKPEQVRANAAAGDWEPTPDDLAALNEIR